MGNNVNPPTQLLLPDEFKNNPKVRKFFERLLFIAFQLFERTGAGRDFISEIQTEKVDFGDIVKPDTSDLIDDDVVVITSDYTTIGNQTIICDDSVTVTLNAEPNDRELAKIHTRNGRVDILGNGKKINDEDDAIIRRDFTTWNILYIVELDGWVII